MKSWPHLVAGLYFILVLLLSSILLPMCLKKGDGEHLVDFLPFLAGIAGVLTAAQVTLLLVPVDLQRERPVSRRRLLVPVIVTGILSSLLMLAGLGCLLMVFFGDKDKPDLLMIQLVPLPCL